MRNALIVGINHYIHGAKLHGCANDARSVSRVLSRHADGGLNFDCRVLTAEVEAEAISRSRLKDEIELLFRASGDTSLFYFAGHGHVESSGGYLLASDSRRGDEGVALSDVVTFASRSEAKNRIIVLDSCHSGIAASRPVLTQVSEIAEGMTILTASAADQYASEQNGIGTFTALFVDALDGAAANLLGDITPGSIYAHIDQSLAYWQQRPVFKTNVKNFVSLRQVNAPIDLADLRKISELFPGRSTFDLDPTFEPELRGRNPDAPPPIPAHTAQFAILQRYARLNLVVPVDAPHMWHAAMESKVCRLTALGDHYRRLAAANRI